MKDKYPILSTIGSPEDLKKIPVKELKTLADELRREILTVVSENGGHLASNLGAIELTIALHRVFKSPVDKIIWDVGHQCYAHKLLTGRLEAFKTLRQLNGMSGFPKRKESEHDIIETGHSSTSISAALGILHGQQLQDIQGKVVAVIGDGSLTGGMALEGLNHAGHMGKDVVIILNDNEMSISKNVGAISSYLSRLAATHTYQAIQRRMDRVVKAIPFIGKHIFNFFFRLKKGLKAILFRENFFSDLGFEYIGPIDGHNMELLLDVLGKVKDIKKPTVVHTITRKGKGYSYAEGDPSLYHGVGTFSVQDGKINEKMGLTFTGAFSGSLVKLAEENRHVVAITAAMASGTGLSLFRELYPERFFDVGITEQHATTFAAGLAVSGMRPVVAIYSTFMQRAVDQVIHDVALTELPVTICMDRAGLVGNDGETHQGVFDIPLFRNIPNITFMAPASAGELDMMLRYSVNLGSPALIRYPRAYCVEGQEALEQPLETGRGVLLSRGGNILAVTVGGLIPEALAAAEILKQQEIRMDVYNLRFIKPLDEDYLIQLLSGYESVVIIEDGVINGGVGERIIALAIGQGLNLRFRCVGVPDDFIEQGSRSELLALCSMDGKGIAETVAEMAQSQKRNLKLV